MNKLLSNIRLIFFKIKPSLFYLKNRKDIQAYLMDFNFYTGQTRNAKQAEGDRA